MARVALCPRCSLESVIPGDAEPNAWAQCAGCNALFQVKDALAREVTELQLLDPTAAPAAPPSTPASTTLPQGEPSALDLDQTVRFSSEKTIGDIGTLERDQQLSHLDATVSEAPPDETPLHSAPTIAETPDAESTSPEGAEAAAQGVEKWFRSAKTVPDVGPLMPDSGSDELPVAAYDESRPAGADKTRDDDVGVDFHHLPSLSQSRPTWDDPEHMDRLLADIDGEPARVSIREPERADLPGHDSTAPAIQTLDDASEVFVSPVGRRRRRSSFARTLVGMVAFGMIGSAIGYYILLAVWGQRVDFLNVAQYVPGPLLPSSFQPAPSEQADTPAPATAVPARFESESAADESLLDDVAKLQSHEPSEFAAPEAAPLPTVAASTVANAPSYSADQLAVALETARKAQPTLVTGSIGDGPAVQKAKGNSFQLLCDLAEKATFVDAASQPDYIAALERESDELFRQTLADAHTRGEVARIVTRWLSYTNRKNQGVFCAGTVLSQNSAGRLVECRVDLGTGEQLTILLTEPQAEQLDNAGRAMGFVGSIVESPSQNVHGYEGDATRAVWVGRLIALE